MIVTDPVPLGLCATVMVTSLGYDPGGFSRVWDFMEDGPLGKPFEGVVRP